MARPRKLIPEIVGINMAELASHLLGMSDSEIGAWLRKAVSDCLNGCVNEDADEFIKKQFNYTVEEMRQKQEHDARTYRNRIARKNNEDASHREADDGDSTGRNAGSADRTTVFNNYGSAKSQGESNTGSMSPVMRPESGIIYDQETAPTSTNEARQSQTDAGTDSLRGLKSSNGVSHCSEAPASNILPLDNAKKPYGTCGHVMLTVHEGHHLRELYGDNLKIAIDILDSYIENNGRKAKKYKNHAAVLRKGNWVWDKVQEMVLKQARIDKAKSQPKSFKQQDLDARTKFFQTSIVERMLQNEQ